MSVAYHAAFLNKKNIVSKCPSKCDCADTVQAIEVP